MIFFHKKLIFSGNCGGFLFPVSAWVLVAVPSGGCSVAVVCRLLAAGHRLWGLQASVPLLAVPGLSLAAPSGLLAVEAPLAVGPRRWGTRAYCPAAYGVFPDPGGSQCPLHCKVGFNHWTTREALSFDFCNLFFIEVQLIYSVVLVSGLQQSDSVLHIYFFPPF